jgi:tetratricopeptide (TPR) repeat protein/tRNA A-37 threonylcarbamoyl transferase component Bud32
MTDPYWQRVEAIFHAALERPPSARTAFVRDQCGGDAVIEAEVREILEGYETQDRLNGQPDGNAGQLRFGAFEAVHKIGEGGMGVVYLGRRLEDFEQQAAIKVISGTPAEMALLGERFRQERQILAGLEHPNIARLLDGGVTSAGQSFLLMEYVEGVPLDRYCDDRGLTIRQRLDLFRKICAAVHFAHQHLVIHRDLKPSNILVNAHGEPKLLDFGIAKLLSDPAESSGSALTITSRMFLTPQYASPEQIRGVPSTVASDVYSLGVVLYQLLTSRTPFSNTATAPAEMIAAILTGEIPRPSAMAPENIKPRLRGDLDGILVKALARHPEDRYGSAEHLSEDIRRHLEGRPVSAVEGTRLYVARKFVRRNRAAAGFAALVVLALVGGLTATLWQARVAERERGLAEQRFSDARKLANYLLFPLYDSIQSLPGSLPVRAEMAAQSLQYLDRLAAAKSSDSALRLELAEGYLRLGAILEAPVGSGDSLGDTGKALEVDRKSIALLEPLSAENGSDAKVQQDLAQAHQLLGDVLNLRGKPDEGIAQLNRAIAIFDRLHALNPRDLESLLGAGRALVALGDAVSGRGGGYIAMASAGGALPAANEAIARFQDALYHSPGENRALLGLAQASNLKGNLVVAGKNVAQGLPVYELGLDALRRLPPAARQSPESQALEARLLTAIGFGEEETGRYGEAIATLAPAQVILDRAAAADPKNATNALRQVNLYRTLAFAYQNSGRTKEAIENYRQTIRILDGATAIDPARQSFRLVRAESQERLGQMLARDHQIAEAEQVSRAGLAYFREIAERPDAAQQNLTAAASAFMNAPIPALNDYRRALRYAQRSNELAKGKDSGAFFYIAQCYEQLGDGPRALDAIQHDLALLPPTPSGEKPSRNRMLAEKHLRRIEALIKTGKLPNEDQ